MEDNFKTPLKIIAVLVCVVLILVVARVTYHYVYQTLPPEQVDVSMRYSPETRCRQDSPLYMLITNDSFREIISTSFVLLVKKRISNDDFIQLSERVYSTDKIIKAGASYEGCWVYPKLNTDYYVPEKLIYEINRKEIIFRD